MKSKRRTDEQGILKSFSLKRCIDENEERKRQANKACS